MTRKERLDVEAEQIRREAKEMGEALKPLDEICELEKWQHETFGYMNQECARGFKEHCLRLESQLAAANATLNKLREMVPEDTNTDAWCACCMKPVKIDQFEDCVECESRTDPSLYETLWAILYPPEGL